MEARSLRGHHHGHQGVDEVHVGRCGLNDLSARVPQHVKALVDQSLHLGCRALAVISAGDSDPDPAQVLAKMLLEIRPFHVDAGRVSLVVAGDHLHHARNIPHRASQWTNHVQARSSRHCAMVWHEPDGRAQADHAGHCGRMAQRATGIGAKRHRHQPGRDRCAGTRRRSARTVLRVPRAASMAIVAVIAGGRESEFSQMQGAEVQCAALVQPLEHGGRGVGNEILADNRAAGASTPSSVQQVLVREWRASQKP